MNKFSPLSQAEIHAASAMTPAAQDDAGEFVAPVPPDAPPIPSRHPQHGAPVARWIYHDAQGRIASAVCRFEPMGERKQIVPLSLWRDGFGQMCWRWKGAPAPRPLFNLDKLAANPDAPVVVVEGEPCADAAARIFPRSVSTTSPAGSQAASKADWTPIAGRRVLVWPDADAPGAKYAREVAETLAGLGCEVSIIDATALAALAFDGSKREPVAGWDAADAAAAWADLGALRKAAHRLAKPFVRENAGASAPVAFDADPLPLRRALPPGEPFPLDALGPILGGAARAIVDKVQCPEALAAGSVLAAASLAAQTHADVILPATGQARPLSLFLVSVAASGERKSAADGEAKRPMRRREARLREQFDEAMRDYRHAKRAYDLALAKAEKAAKRRPYRDRRRLALNWRRTARAAVAGPDHRRADRRRLAQAF